MDKIRLLPEKIANQIAAGEVVTHPASVVKEMMENCIDAGATDVVVNYRKSGNELIQIIDNGVGMSPNDARMAFERHATSKIKTTNDIYNLHTFGFRGEALASIAAVARVELKSRCEGEEIGTLTIMESGEFVDQQPVMCEKGSQFLVKELFAQLPARRRFLERERGGANSIKSEFQRVVLCNPQVSFELYGDDAPIYKLHPTSMLGRILDVAGRGLKDKLLEVSVETSIVKISGFIGNSKAIKKNNQDQYMFVNGRYFKSPYLYKALLSCYDKLIPANYHPSYFLFFEVNPEDVDVNIHPQKTEVSFEDKESIWQILQAGVRETLARTGAVPMMEFDNDSNIEIPVLSQGVMYDEPKAISNSAYNPFEQEYSSVGEGSFLMGETSSDEFETIEVSKAAPAKSSGGGRNKVLKSYVNSDFEVGLDDSEVVSAGWNDIEYEPTTPAPAIDEYENFEDFEDIESVRPKQSTIEEVAPTIKSETIDYNVLSLTNGRYAWCRMGANMAVVDIKRAKERLLYDHYIATIESGASHCQKILFPIDLRLSESEYSIMESNAAEFALFGFEIDFRGNEMIEVRGLPADVTTESADRLIYELIHLLTTPESITQNRKESIARVMAINSSKAMGKIHNTQQAKEIITQLVQNGNLGVTPSGKSIIWQIGNDVIRKNLG